MSKKITPQLTITSMTTTSKLNEPTVTAEERKRDGVIWAQLFKVCNINLITPESNNASKNKSSEDHPTKISP